MKTFLKILFFFLLVTQICFAQWYEQNSQTTQNLKALTFIDANNGILVGDSGTIHKTIDGGTNWTPVPSGTMKDFSAICFTDANNGWAITGNEYDDYHPFDSSIVLHTTNGGTTWTTQIKVPTSKLYDVSFVNASTGIVVGGGMDSLGYIYSIILKTTNGGLTWNQQIIDTIKTLIKVCFFDLNNAWIIEAATGGWYTKKIHRTTDGGTNWYLQLKTPYYWEYLSDISFADLNNGIAVGGEFSNIGWKTGLIAKTTDGGETWVKQYISGSPDYAFDFIDVCFITNSIITVLGDDGQVLYWTTDGGITWTIRPSGMNTPMKSLFFIDTNNGWIVGDYGTILHTTNGGVTFVEEELNKIPTEFALEQNFPNPFNSTSVIKYSIPKSSQVSLKIFNTLGEELETLVNEEKSSGIYEVNWNAANLPSGVYFYRLQARDFVQTRKMILLK